MIFKSYIQYVYFLLFNTNFNLHPLLLQYFLDVPDLDVHDAGEDGGELLLGGAAYDGLLVLAVLCPQGGD